MSRSRSSRPSSSSRTAPPTTNAPSPASTSRAVSSIDDDPPRPPRVRADAADELVVDRPGDTRVLLGEDALPEDRDRRADRLLTLQLDRERVHRDRPHHTPRHAAHPYLRSGQVAAETVRVADRNDPDPGRLLGDEAPPVARALSRLQLLDLREITTPGERRLEPVRGRVLAERREPVERDPAARRVEAGRRQPERRRAVRRVTHQVGVLLGHGADSAAALRLPS